MTIALTYEVGDTLVYTATCRDDDEVLADPTGLTFTLAWGPNTVEYVYGVDSNVTKESTGIYKCKHEITSSAVHRMRAVATGTVTAAGQLDVNVRPINTTL